MISLITLLPDVLIEGNTSFMSEASYYSGQKINFLVGDVSGTQAYSTAPIMITAPLNIGGDAFSEEDNAAILNISKNSDISTDLGAGIGSSFSGLSKIAATLTDPSVNNTTISSDTVSGLTQFWG